MSLRIVITTTLNNNLFHAKLVPLLRSRPDLEVVVVTDRQGPSEERLKWVWPRGIWKKFGRLGGRLPLLAREVFHPRTRLVMAYSLVPHGLFAVNLGHLRRLPVYLHFIAGPAEIRFAHNVAVKPLYLEMKELAASFKGFRISHIPRRQNAEADELANMAFQQ